MTKVSDAIKSREETERDYLSAVKQGMVPGAAHVHKFGQGSIDSADPIQAIWQGEAPYPYMTAAAGLYISSDDAGDTEVITVIGLDADWNEQTVTVTLAGQTKTEIGSGVTWLRVYRAYNSNGTDLVGNIYIYQDDTVTGGVPDNPATKLMAKIEPEDQQTQMALITVPAGKVGRVWSFGGSILDAEGGPATVKAADIKLRVREFGKVFRNQENLGLSLSGTNNDDLDGKPYWIFPEKTDIEIAAVVSADGTELGGRITITIEDAG